MVIVELLSWWAVALGIWMASLSAYSGQELLVAACCAVPCAAAAVGVRRAVEGAWRLPRETLRWLWMLPLAVVVDAARVLSWPARSRSGGSWRTVDVAGRGDKAEGSGRRAAASFVLSSTPGSFVAAADEHAGTLTVHSLGAPSLIERAVSK